MVSMRLSLHGKTADICRLASLPPRGFETAESQNGRSSGLLIWGNPEIANAFTISAAGASCQIRADRRNAGKAPIFRRGNSNRSSDSDREARPIVSMRLAIPRT
jgi:hypothetical protein